MSAASVHVHSSRYSYIVPLVRATATTPATNVTVSITTRPRATRSRRAIATTSAATNGASSSGTIHVFMRVVEPSSAAWCVPVIQSGRTANCPPTIRALCPIVCAASVFWRNHRTIVERLPVPLHSSHSVGNHTTASRPTVAAAAATSARVRSGARRRTRTASHTAPIPSAGNVIGTNSTWVCIRYDATSAVTGSDQMRPSAIAQVSRQNVPNGRTVIQHTQGSMRRSIPNARAVALGRDQDDEPGAETADPLGDPPHRRHGGAVDQQRTHHQRVHVRPEQPVGDGEEVVDEGPGVRPAVARIEADRHRVDTDVADLQLHQRPIGDRGVAAVEQGHDDRDHEREQGQPDGDGKDEAPPVRGRDTLLRTGRHRVTVDHRSWGVPTAPRTDRT